MSWRVLATVMVVIFALAVAQAALASPLHEVTSKLNDTGDYSNLEGVDGYDGNAVIGNMFGHWMNMGLMGMFGIMLWGVARVVRRELTRGGLR